MSKRIILLFIVILSFVSCVGNQNNILDNTFEPTIQTSVAIDYPKTQCFQENQKFDGDSYGSLIMINSEQTELKIKVLSTGEDKIIPLEENNIIENVITTSESNMFGYQTYSHTTKTSKLYIVESFEKPETIYDLSSDIRRIIGFIDRTKILVSIKNASIDERPVVDDLAVLDVSKNEYEKINIDLPDFSDWLPRPAWEMYSFSSVVPSKDFKYLIYQKRWDSNHKTSVSLWDSKHSREVTHIYQPLNISFTPQWSSDSEYFIINSPVDYKKEANEFYKVMITGEMKQLTGFSDKHPESHIGYYKLSPDNKTIGFPFDEGSDKETTLLLLKLSSEDLIDTCIQIYPYSLPIWAPNRNALIVGNYRDHVGPVYLVDIINRSYSIIDQDRYAKGWILN